MSNQDKDGLSTSNNEDTQMTQEQLMFQQIILEKDQEIAKLEKAKALLTNRSLSVHEKNQMLTSSPDLAARMADFDFEMKMAERFVQSGAFPTQNAAQAYTLIKAGQEMGLTPIVSLNMLYVIKGSINPYGDKMLGLILSKGYKVKYEDETHESVKVTIYNDSESYTEIANKNDKVLSNSNAMAFAPKNKLRFHGIRMIASFHLPHLFMGISDIFTSDYNAQEINQTEIKVSNKDLLEAIESATDKDELYDIEQDNIKEISRNGDLVMALGKSKKRLGI